MFYLFIIYLTVQKASLRNTEQKDTTMNHYVYSPVFATMKHDQRIHKTIHPCSCLKPYAQA